MATTSTFIPLSFLLPSSCQHPFDGLSLQRHNPLNTDRPQAGDWLALTFDVLESIVNYVNTFIAVSPDTKAKAGSAPPARDSKRSIAQIEYELIAAQPYKFTQEEVQFSVHVERTGITAAQLKAKRNELRSAFFSKPMACMRTSPLAKSYGWGLHFDSEGKVALVAMESQEYRQLSSSPSIEQTRAMRSKRP